MPLGEEFSLNSGKCFVPITSKQAGGNPVLGVTSGTLAHL